MGDVERRRRRLRHHSDATGRNTGGSAAATGRDTEGPAAGTTGVHDPEPPRRRGGPAAEERDGERGLRGLIGPGSSQVGRSAALRARDAARPTEEDLAEAEARLVIVRRNWVPREDLPRAPTQPR